MTDTNSDDEALARLRASDPATGSHPDLYSLRRAIARKAPASQEHADSVTRVTDDPFRGPRLRAPWIAAAAVAAIGIGAGGYALGAQSTTPDPVARQGSTDLRPAGAEDDTDDGAPEIGGDAGPEVAGEAGDQGGSASTSSGPGGVSSLWDPGPVRLVAGPGLPAEEGTGQVRALIGPEGDHDFLRAWAGRLGIEGDLTEVSSSTFYGGTFFGGTALVDAENGTLLTITSEAPSPLSLSYEDVFGSPECSSMFAGLDDASREQLEQEWETAVGEGVPLPDPSRCETLEGERPTEDEALAAAQEWVESTGLDFPDLELAVSPYQDPTSPTVFVEGTPDGVLAGQVQVHVSVGPQGVYQGSGTYAELRSLGDYPTISAVEAVARYGQRPFAEDYGVQLPEDFSEGSFHDLQVPPVEPHVPEPPEVTAGMKIPLLLKEKTVTGAELVQGFVWTQAGTSLEVPAWRLTTEDGMHYAVLAVADEAIDWVSWE